MNLLSEETLNRIREERALLMQGLPRPEVQLVFRKLDEAADAMLLRYDAQDFIKEPAKAVYIQCFRDVVKKEIPRIFETILNVDVVKDELSPNYRAPWSFRRWLATKLENLATRITRETATR